MNRKSIISDCSGRIAILVYSDAAGLKGHLDYGPWQKEMIKSLYQELRVDKEGKQLDTTLLRVELHGISKTITSDDDLGELMEAMERDEYKTFHDQRSGNSIQGGHLRNTSPQLNMSSGAEVRASRARASTTGNSRCIKSDDFVRDHFLVTYNGIGTEILDKCYSLGQQSRNPFVNKLVVDFSYLSTTGMTIPIEGGDVLVADSRAILGMQTIGVNRAIGPPRVVLSKAEAMLGRPVFCPGLSIGNYPEALFHLDLYLTVLKEENGRISIAIGKVHTWEHGQLKPFDGSTTDSMAGEIQAYLDKVTTALINEGCFDIMEWPLIVDGPLVYSYNNCLVDRPSTSESIRRLFLPSYMQDANSADVEKFIQAEKKLTNALSTSFDIRWIKGCFYDDVQAKGSLRCLTQVLLRSPN